MLPDGKISIAAGAMNTGRASYPGTTTLDAWLTITEKDTDLVAIRSSFNYLPTLGAMKTAYPFHMNVKVKPGDYVLSIVSERTQSFSMDISIQQINGELVLYAPLDKLTANDDINISISAKP